MIRFTKLDNNRDLPIYPKLLLWLSY